MRPRTRRAVAYCGGGLGVPRLALLISLAGAACRRYLDTVAWRCGLTSRAHCAVHDVVVLEHVRADLEVQRLDACTIRSSSSDR
jgi:hypothetical protein